jgi:predicted RNA binding protein YcfA (HicA-like mRNA interferase family)
MPPKIRQLKAALSKAGFYSRSAKGSHAVWIHPTFPKIRVTSLAMTETTRNDTRLRMCKKP